MNPETARIFLGLDEDADQEDLMDTLESKVFDLRSFFLQQPVVPVLYRSRIDRLTKLQVAYEALGGETVNTPVRFPEIPILNELSLIELLETHAGFLAACRSQMARTLWPQPLIELAQRMIAMQDRFEALFLDLTSDLGVTNEEQVKQSDQLDLGQVLHDLRAGGPKAVGYELAKEHQRIQLKQQARPN